MALHLSHLTNPILLHTVQSLPPSAPPPFFFLVLASLKGGGSRAGGPRGFLGRLKGGRGQEREREKRNEISIVMSNIQEQILAAIANGNSRYSFVSCFLASKSLSVTCPSMLSAYHSPSTSHRQVVHETVPIPAARAPPLKYVLSRLVSSRLVLSCRRVPSVLCPAAAASSNALHCTAISRGSIARGE